MVCALNVFKLSVIYALLGGIILILLLSMRHYKAFVGAINAGAKDSILALINTCAAVGFGSVVKVMPSFQTLANHFLSTKFNPLITEAITINILAGATGSASGGMGIALESPRGKIRRSCHKRTHPPGVVPQGRLYFFRWARCPAP